MKEIGSGHFYGRLRNKKRHHPLNGQIELTYRCNFNCIHCYCKALEDNAGELNTLEWKKTLDEIQSQGCVYLTLTGGDPLIREDFLELYAYAKKRCFIITIFTNGQSLNRRILNYLAKSPPFSIEITLNGITKETYESITQVKDSFSIVMENIKKIKEKNLPLVLKSNCLKQNKDEIARIKSFVDGFLGKKRGRYHFKYDPMIYPRLNKDKRPTRFRLSFEDLLDLKRQDVDIWQEHRKRLDADFPDLGRDKGFLYHCNAWIGQFFINPYGRLKFCNFSGKFSIDLKTTAFKEGFYKIFPNLLNEKFKTDSKCKDCQLRPICYHCPGRAYLETGDEEAPVPYYCELAKETAKLMGYRQ
ncbi:MAG: radical SAM protein [Candidatus Omnitrophota bacterium]|nr:radical SAM protein [Candidatus Omnitrophota bacterium]